MNVYLFERLFNLGNNYARMRSCRVEGHSQIDLKGQKIDKISDHIAKKSEMKVKAKVRRMSHWTQVALV